MSGNGKGDQFFRFRKVSIWHPDHRLPARISESLAAKAKAMAVRIAEQLNLSGTFAWKCLRQLTTLSSMRLLPRPHNSGHYSIEVYDFSQFDTHILGSQAPPLPAIKLHAPAVILDQHVEDAENMFLRSAHLHVCR